MTDKLKELKNALSESGKASFTNQDILSIGKSLGIDHNNTYKVIRKMHKIRRGVYTLEAPKVVAPAANVEAKVAFRGVASVSNDEVYVPSVDPTSNGVSITPL